MSLRTRTKQEFLSIVLSLASLFVAQKTEAQRVAVLGVTDAEGHAEEAQSFTDSLRSAAKKVRSWKLSKNPATIDQMTLAFGCDRPNTNCLSEIAAEMKVKGIVFGSIQNASQSGISQITLSYFSTRKGSILRSSEKGIQTSNITGKSGKKLAERMIGILAGTFESGEILIISEPNATVLVDGNYEGITNADGRLLVRDIQVGTRTLTLTNPDGKSTEHDVEVNENNTSNIRLDTETQDSPQTPTQKEEGGLDLRIPFAIGGALVGAALLSLGIYSMTQVKSYADEEQEIYDLLPANPNAEQKRQSAQQIIMGFESGRYSAFQLAYAKEGFDQQNICDADLNVAQKKACDDLDKHSTLQYALTIAGAGVFAISMGVLIWALLDGDDDKESSDTSWMITPTFDGQNLGISGVWTF